MTRAGASHKYRHLIQSSRRSIADMPVVTQSDAAYAQNRERRANPGALISLEEHKVRKNIAKAWLVFAFISLLAGVGYAVFSTSGIVGMVVFVYVVFAFAATVWAMTELY